MQGSIRPIYSEETKTLKSSNTLLSDVATSAAREGRCASAPQAAYGCRTGRAMQSLSLPLPTPPSFPSKRLPIESRSHLLKYSVNPGQKEQLSYPSPPMSDSLSPAGRSAQISEPEGFRQPPPLHDTRNMIGYAPHLPAPSALDPRLAPSALPLPHAQPLYPDSQISNQQYDYPSGRKEDVRYGATSLPPNYAYGYPAQSSHTHPSEALGALPYPSQAQAMIPQVTVRQPKPARRTKAHVASACVNCKKAHLSCDVQRPCGRCVSSGKQDTCKDVQHKKRGRPRLRDDKDFARSEDQGSAPSQMLGRLSGSMPTHGLGESVPTPHGDAWPPLDRSHEVRGQSHYSATSASSTFPRRDDIFPGSTLSPQAAHLRAPQEIPTAYLDLDLIVKETNRAFTNLPPFPGDVRGRPLSSLIHGRQHETLQRLRNELRDEREARDPTYMAPITPSGQDSLSSMLQSTPGSEVERASDGYAERSVVLDMLSVHGPAESFQCRISLAKTSIFFVILVVVDASRQFAPPLQTQYPVPHALIESSKPMSAPATSSAHDFPTPASRIRATSTTSAPTSPYYSFTSGRSPQPPASSSSISSRSPGLGQSPVAIPEAGYPTLYPGAPQPTAYPSSYQPLSRVGSIATASVTSEPRRDSRQPSRLEDLQLPPIRTSPSDASRPVGQAVLEGSGHADRKRPRDEADSTEPSPDTSESSRRRRLRLQEVLD